MKKPPEVNRVREKIKRHVGECEIHSISKDYYSVKNFLSAIEEAINDEITKSKKQNKLLDGNYLVKLNADYDGYSIELYLERLEDDEEYNRRITYEESILENYNKKLRAKKEAISKKELEEKKLYLELKKKYEN